MATRIKTIEYLKLNVRQKTALIGSNAFHRNRYGVYFPVMLCDYKEAYGRDRFLVRPVGGRGQFWAQSHALTLELD